MTTKATRMRTWDERGPYTGPEPEPKWAETKERAKKQKVVRPAQPIQPIPETIELMQQALEILDTAQAKLDRGGRSRDAMNLLVVMNDLRHRCIPYSGLVACTDCAGYQQGTVDKAPQTCFHQWNIDAALF